LFTKAEQGYTASGTSTGKGGLATLVSLRWSNLICQSGSILDGKVQWLIFSTIQGGDLGFINVYAPCNSLARHHLWETMSNDLPTSCHWIMIGDFNMVELRIDKSSSCGEILLGPEHLLFNALKDTIQVLEFPWTSPNMTYSWDNFRSDGARVLARLDRCYIFPDSPTSSRQIIEYCICGDHTCSDHSPLLVVLQLALVTPQPSRWIMSPVFLDEASILIRETWIKTPLVTPFFSKLK